jgi:putative sigma-54 modulation protein
MSPCILVPARLPPDTFCEIRLEVPGNDLFVKESAQDDFEQAIDTTVNKLQGILRKQKEKQVDQWQVEQIPKIVFLLGCLSVCIN